MAELDKLVEQYVNGNKDVFDQIYEETKRSVYLSIYAIISDHDMAESIMQDAYLKALDALASYKVGSNFKAWISRIARNTAINYYNRESKISYVDAYDNDEAFGSSSSTPLIDSALAILDGSEKEVFTYRIILGYKFKDIGKILNMNLKTAFAIYKKAINKVKEQI